MYKQFNLPGHVLNKPHPLDSKEHLDPLLGLKGFWPIRSKTQRSIPYSGLWVNHHGDAVHRHTQLPPVSDVHTLVSEHVAADTVTGFYFKI